jgi:hypothetical protein
MKSCVVAFEVLTALTEDYGGPHVFGECQAFRMKYHLHLQCRSQVRNQQKQLASSAQLLPVSGVA